jgi:hypothetical protein
MRYQVVGSDGWRSSKYTDRQAAVDGVRYANTASPGNKHRVVRLLNRREAMRKRLTSDREHYAALARDCRATGDESQRVYYIGMAYAISGVLKQL